MKALGKHIFDGNLFGKALRQKRVVDLDVDLRTVSKKTGISISTLSRCENGGMPELTTFFDLCRWLQRPVDEFIFLPQKKQKT